MATYFAQDGSFGDAHGIIILDTDDWTNKQWLKIDQADDDDRIVVALEIATKRKDI